MYTALDNFDFDSDNDDMQVVPVPSTVNPTVQALQIPLLRLPVRPYGATSVTPDTTPVMPAPDQVTPTPVVLGTPVVPLTSLGKEAVALPPVSLAHYISRKNVMAARDAWLRSHQAKTGQSQDSAHLCPSIQQTSWWGFFRGSGVDSKRRSLGQGS
jgi:hypothetical protein